MDANESDASRCSRCGAVIPSGAQGGVCPRCALANALDTPGDEHDSQFLSLHDIPPAGEKVSYIGDYELLEVIAHGGMGVVYRARQRSLNRIVALKMLLGGVHAGDDFKRRFRQEAKTAAQLQHPNIVPIYEVGEHLGQPYFSMEYVPGETLAQKVRERPLPAPEAANYVQTVAEAVHYAHQQKILHRDLKPSNILLGTDDRPRVTDFGLARQVDADSSLTQSGHALGTPGYLPPEQVTAQRGAMGPWSDVYALGAVLYHLVTGRPPFAAGSVADTLEQVRHTEPAPPRQLNPAVPKDLETICLKCLEKDPTRRYKSAQSLADDLARFLRGEPISARPITSLGRAAKWIQRNPIIAFLVASVVLVGAVGLAGVSWQWSQRQSARQQVWALQGRVVAGELEAGEFASAMRRFANKLRTDPRDSGTAQRLVNALAQRNIPLPTGEPIRPTMPGLQDAFFTPDGRHLFIRTYTLIETRDASTRQPLSTWTGGLQSISAFKVSPNGALAAIGYEDGTVSVEKLASSNSSPVLVAPASRMKHKGAVRAMEFSGDGRLLVTGGEDQTARVWSVTKEKEVAQFTNHTGAVVSVSFDAGGTDVLSASAGGTVVIWEAATGRQIETIERDVSSEFSVDEITDLTSFVTKLKQRQSSDLVSDFIVTSFSPDTQAAISGYNGLDNNDKALANILVQELNAIIRGASIHMAVRFAGVQLRQETVDLLNRNPQGSELAWLNRLYLEDCYPLELPRKRRNAGAISFAVYAPGASKALVAAADTISLWNRATRRVLHNAIRTASPVTQAHFSPDGGRLLTVSGKVPLHGLASEVRLWDVRTGAALTAPWVHPDNVASAEFSPEGLRVLTACGDGSARIFDARSGEPISMPMSHPRGLWNAHFSPDGLSVVTACDDGLVRIWDVTPSQQAPLSTPVARLSGTAALRPDGQLVATATGTQVHLWNPHSGEVVGGPLGHPGQVNLLSFLPRTDRLAVLCSNSTVALLWDTTAGKVVAGPHLLAGAATTLKCSPDGRTIAIAMGDQGVALWRGNSNMTVLAQAGAKRLAWTADNRRLIVASRWGTNQTLVAPIWIWEVDQRRVLLKLSGYEGVEPTVAFDPTGNKVAAGFVGGNVEIWDSHSGAHLLRLTHQDAVSDVAFSPDGRLLLTSGMDGVAKVWDTQSGLEALEPLRHKSWVRRGAFSRDGRWILTTSMDGTARLWESASGLPVTEPLKHPFGIMEAELSSDASLLLTQTRGAGAFVWHLPVVVDVLPDSRLADLASLFDVRQAAPTSLGFPANTTNDAESQVLDRLRKSVASDPRTDVYTRFLRWFFADRKSRTIAPNATARMPDYFAQLMSLGTVASLEEAVRLSPKNADALVSLAAHIVDEKSNPRRFDEADFFVRHALELDPNLGQRTLGLLGIRARIRFARSEAEL